MMWIVGTNAWHIVVTAKGVFLHFDLSPNEVPFVWWGEA